MERFIEQPSVGQHLDVSDGPTKNIDVEKYRSYLNNVSSQKQNQKSNYESWINNIESGKPINNPYKGSMGKNSPFGI